MPVQGITTENVIKNSSYLTTFSCQYGRYRLTRPPFGVSPADDMLQRKISEIFKGLLKVFGIADDILIAGHNADGRNHDRTLRQMMQIYYWGKPKI